METELRMTEAEPVRTYEAQQAQPLMDREVAYHPAEETIVAEPTARLRPMEGTVAPEPFSRLQPAQAEHIAEPMAQLRPMEGTVAAEPFSRLQPAQAEHIAEPMAQLRPMEGTVAAEPFSRLQPAQAEHIAEPMGQLRPMERADAAAPMTRALPVQSTAPAAAAADAKRLAPTQAAASQAGGSAGSGFQVDPDQYRAAVSPVLAAADQLSQLVTGLTAFLDHTQSTAPWGNDESGKKFAEGEKGYLKYSTDTLKGLKGMPDAVRYIADGLKAMADNYRATEEDTTSVFQDDGGSDTVSVPQTGTYAAPVNVMTPLAPRVGTTVHPSTIRRA
ncbi:hypothetical protein [Kitasatospora paranensis]|uniref:hypothetical protein n=1 Tax=Kitasatospora paranensis TaxID=258053 RepID=UPI0031E66A46